MAEMLSPIVKNSSVRRLSLDLCHKFGSQLLSPNTNNTKRKLSVPAYLSQLDIQGQGSLSTGSTQLISPLFLSQHNKNETKAEVVATTPEKSNRRRGSDCYSHNACNVFIKSLENSQSMLNTPSGISKRRSSLNSLKNLSFGQNNSYNSPKHFNSTNLSISPIPSSPNYEGYNFETSICSDSDGLVGHGGQYQSGDTHQILIQPISPENLNVNLARVSYQVFPPTPKHDQNLTPKSTRSSSEEEGKVFDSPSSVHSSSQIRRNSYSRPERGLNTRRKSSTTRYDFDEDFLKLVLLRCRLELSPETVLGKGSFGTVVAGIYKGDAVAVKVIRTEGESRKDSIKGEENGMALAPHPHIAKVIDILQIQPTRALVIIERLQTGNLLAMINDPDVHFDLYRDIKISSEVASALMFCHSQGILHLDLKPQNVLLHIDGSCKLSDFGNSKRISELKYSKNSTKLDGTVAYKAPELFRGVIPTPKCDVYSLGIFMWQLLTREQPYMGETEHSLIYKVVAQGLRPKSVCAFLYINANVVKRSERVGKEYKNLYEKCWDGNPDIRPSMESVYNHFSVLQNNLKTESTT